MGFQQERILMVTFFESQFEFIYVYEFQKKKRILMKAFVEPQFEVIEVYEFQTKLNSYEDTC